MILSAKSHNDSMQKAVGDFLSSTELPELIFDDASLMFVIAAGVVVDWRRCDRDFGGRTGRERKRVIYKLGNQGKDGIEEFVSCRGV